MQIHKSLFGQSISYDKYRYMQSLFGQSICIECSNTQSFLTHIRVQIIIFDRVSKMLGWWKMIYIVRDEKEYQKGKGKQGTLCPKERTNFDGYPYSFC